MCLLHRIPRSHASFWARHWNPVFSRRRLMGMWCARAFGLCHGYVGSNSISRGFRGEFSQRLSDNSGDEAFSVVLSRLPGD